MTPESMTAGFREGFSNEEYICLQSAKIRERIETFGGKLYMEFGGKLFDDHHASRVLPGFQPDSKLQMLLQLKDEAEIVMVISALDIEKNKVRGEEIILSDEGSKVVTMVVPTDEEMAIARETVRLVK